MSFDLALDINKNVYTVDRFDNTIDFDPGIGVFNLTANGMGDIFVSKLDSSGNFLWAENFGGPCIDFAKDIEVDGNNNIIVTGSFCQTVDFDPGPALYQLSTYGYGAFIIKLDASGNLIWAKQMTGSQGSSSEGMSLAIDNIGNVFTAGNYTNDIDVDPGPNVYNLFNANVKAIYLIKLASNGDFIFAKTYTGGTLLVKDLKLGMNKEINIIGSFYNFMDMDPGANVIMLNPNNGYYDIFVSRLDSNGNYIFGKHFGGILNDHGASIALGNAGTIYGTGNFQATADFDPGPNVFNLITATINVLDIVVFKFSYCPSNSYSSIIDSACGSYNFNGQNYTSSGVYTVTIPNASGCDSIITLTLNIWQLNTGVTQNGLTFTANASGVGYQWIKCNPYQILLGENNQTYTATTNGDYAVIINGAECTDTSACFSVHGVGISDALQAAKISLYPNPVDQKLVIESENNLQSATLSIRTSTGQVVMEEIQLTGRKTELDVSKLASGIYFVEIEERGYKYVKAITKE